VNPSDVEAEIALLARELKTPVITATFQDLAEQARAEAWSHETYLAAVLARQVASRTVNGTRMRVAGAHFPQTKTIEDFSFTGLPAAARDTLAHLATTTFIGRRENVVLLGPPGLGKTWARPTWPSRSGLRPARPVTPSRSPAPPAGSAASQQRTTATPWNASSAGSTATGS